jgi:hypothetical protein
MKILLGIGVVILLKIIAFQNNVMSLWNRNETASTNYVSGFQLSDFDFILIKVFILLTIATMIFTWVRKKMKHQRVPLSSFKSNVALLREEKIRLPQNNELRKKRRKLVKSTFFSGQLNHKSISGKARKLGIPSGELMLAAKIKSSTK